MVIVIRNKTYQSLKLVFTTMSSMTSQPETVVGAPYSPTRLSLSLSLTARLGVRHHHPPRPQAQVLGAGGEDVPHQPAPALGAAPPEGPHADGGVEKGTVP